ncbi:hypothetical protein ANN_15337 [Periplaneta americana]|uniref:Uncharacterized protein n=1 Tax=Periplaneta americana TaxID=6978 RepID=A0ABQ8SHY9_PERAM|nr:hypothetical protein ANN_15337 [Periplaneta americana]
MAGLCESGNEPSGSLKAICETGIWLVLFVSACHLPRPRDPARVLSAATSGPRPGWPNPPSPGPRTEQLGDCVGVGHGLKYITGVGRPTRSQSADMPIHF